MVKVFVFILLVALILAGGVYFMYRTPQNTSVSESTQENEQKEEAQDEKVPLSDMAGRMIIAGFRGTSAPEDSYVASLINDVHPGALILFDRDLPSGNTFPRNITDPTQVRSLIAELKNHADYPLLVAVDAEGGRVNRLNPSYGFVSLASHETLGAGTPAQTEEAASTLAEQLSDLGIDINFAPVVDVNVNPQSPAIGALGRSFSSDSATVASHAQAFVDAHHKYSVHTALKHFPGHGSATGDTHRGVVDVTQTWEEYELNPYRTLIESGYKDPIMTAHVVNQTYSDLPATLAPEILTDLLRKSLGFKGVIVTDDMQMGAIQNEFGLEEAAVRAIEAGADMIIISNNIETYDPQAPYKVRNAIVEAVNSGRLTEERVRESFKRIEELYTSL